MSLLRPKTGGESPRPRDGGLLVNRLALASFLLIAGLIGGCKGKVEAAVSERALSVQAAPVAREKQEGYNFKDYEPPKEFGSRIPLDREFVPGRKTVVYIVDQHPDPRFSGEEAIREGKLVQRQLFFMLKDILDRAGTLPVVTENWPYELEGMSFGQLGETIGDGLSPGERGVLLQMFQTDDLGEKMRLASENVGKDAVVGGMYMMAASPRVKALGSVNAAEISGILASVNNLSNAQYALDHPESVLCEPPDGKLNFAEASRRFNKGDKSSKVVDCFCAVRLEIEEIVRGFAQDRFVDAPRREVERALNFDGDFVVVVAGLNHLKEALRRLVSEDVNVVLLSPNGLSAKFPAALSADPEMPDITPKDDKNGTCAKNEARLRELARKAAEQELIARQKAQDEALTKWLLEDEGEQF